MVAQIGATYTYFQQQASGFVQESLDTVRKVAKRVLEVARGILLAPVVGVVSSFEGSKVFFHKLSYADTGGSLALCKQKVIAKNPVILDTPEDYYSWKMELIKSAKHSIEISNYCGGKPFQETLEIIARKIEENPHFKARILTNSYTIDREEQRLLDALRTKHPNNFEVIVVPIGCFTFSPKLKRHEHHAKMVIADQKYCVMGGSLLTNLILPHGTVKAAGGKMSHLADGVCDLDIASEGNIAESLKLQFDQLWLKWKRIEKIEMNPALDTGFQFSSQIERAEIAQFQKKKIVDEMACKLFLSQPEQGKENLSLKKYVKLITQAKKSIVVAHVSLNEKNILRALAEAIRRGVKVEVITNGHSDHSATAGKICAARNRLNYRSLLNAARESTGSVQIYEHQGKDLLFHAKSMIFDDEVLVLGSTNITRESIKCDDEVLLVTKSRPVVDRVRHSFQKFKAETSEVTEESMESCSFTWSLIKGYLIDIFLKNLCD